VTGFLKVRSGEFLFLLLGAIKFELVALT